MAASLARRIDPLAKLLTLVGVSAWGMMPNSVFALLSMTGCIVAVYLLLGSRELAAARSFAGLIVFIPSLLLIYHVLLVPVLSGHGWAQRAVILSGSINSVRILNSVLLVVWLLVSTDARALLARTQRIGVPRKVAFTVYLMLRYADVLRAEAEAVRDALRVRFGGKRSVRFVVLFFQRYITTLVILGVRRAEQTALAMDLRGFSEDGPKTLYARGDWLRAGWVVPVLFLCASATFTGFIRP